jgi:hypothetical protein
MYLAALEDVLPLLIPFVVFLVPIVAILTHHQRKMAELYHGNRQPLPDQSVEALKHEIAELKQVVHQQTVAIDSLSRPQGLSSPEGISQRIG